MAELRIHSPYREGDKINQSLYAIEHLRNQLDATDYIILKLSEAETDEEKQAIRTEYADVLAQRRQWRARINELQGSD